jgi:hypothetical protein
MSASGARPAGARPARVDPAGRPLHNRRRQGLQAIGIVAAWIGLMVLLFWASGSGPGKTQVVIPWLLATGLVSWLLAEKVVGKHGLVWPGSALGVVGPLSVGLAMSVLTPDMRAAPPEEQIAVLSGTSAFLMALFVWRFRLPGLISPVVTFTIVALFLGIYGVDPERLREVEGFSPRGILAAMMQSTAWVLAFGSVSGAAVVLARWLDLNGDDFGLAAARPLHVIGAGVFALVLGRWLGLLPFPLDVVALALAWGAGILWALRINRIAVMFATQLAMTRPMVLSVATPLGFSLDRRDWGSFITVMMAAGMAYWPLLHEQSLRRGWTLGPGRRIPQPRNNWWWRYWPYA